MTGPPTDTFKSCIASQPGGPGIASGTDSPADCWLVDEKNTSPFKALPPSLGIMLRRHDRRCRPDPAGLVRHLGEHAFIEVILVRAVALHAVEANSLDQDRVVARTMAPCGHAGSRFCMPPIRSQPTSAPDCLMPTSVAPTDW